MSIDELTYPVVVLYEYGPAAVPSPAGLTRWYEIIARRGKLVGMRIVDAAGQSAIVRAATVTGRATPWYLAWLRTPEVHVALDLGPADPPITLEALRVELLREFADDAEGSDAIADPEACREELRRPPTVGALVRAYAELSLARPRKP